MWWVSVRASLSLSLSLSPSFFLYLCVRACMRVCVRVCTCACVCLFCARVLCVEASANTKKVCMCACVCLFCVCILSMYARANIEKATVDLMRSNFSQIHLLICSLPPPLPYFLSNHPFSNFIATVTLVNSPVSIRMHQTLQIRESVGHVRVPSGD